MRYARRLKNGAAALEFALFHLCIEQTLYVLLCHLLFNVVAMPVPGGTICELDGWLRTVYQACRHP
jgi:hypothetical protein